MLFGVIVAQWLARMTGERWGDEQQIMVDGFVEHAATSIGGFVEPAPSSFDPFQQVIDSFPLHARGLHAVL